MNKAIASLLCGVVFATASLSSGACVLAAVPVQPGAAGQPQVPSDSDTHPGVARISLIEAGAIVVQRSDSQKQVTGTINAPLFPGDFITTGTDARAEVQFDGFSMLRLSSNVQARIVASDATSRQVQLAAGTVELAVLHAEDTSTTIDTPSVTIRASQPGDFRITVDGDGTTTATARTGTATLQTPQHSYAMESGTTYVASGGASNPTVTQTKEIGYDAFDDFNAHRDKALFTALNTDTNVPPSLAGYDNLNAYGRWVAIAPYGQVWVPAGVGSDWAPYRDGQWTWTASYGWTWVSSEPWGWVPYHYGRWSYQAGYGWCWVPPAIAIVPAWQPALVGFFGWGYAPLWGFSFGFAAFGWVPLAPYETYYPWYSYNPSYSWQGNNPQPKPTAVPLKHHAPVTRTPVPVLHSAPATYRNARFGATGVDANSFHDGDFTHAAAVDMTHLDHLSPMHAAVPLTPSAANLAFTRTKVVTPVAISHVFSEPRFAPVARTQSPEAWSRFDSARGESVSTHEGTALHAVAAHATDASNGHDPYPMSSQKTYDSTLTLIHMDPAHFDPSHLEPSQSAPAHSQPSHSGSSNSSHSAPSHPSSDPKGSSSHPPRG